MTKPRILDLFCCAGGAGEGYARAGFEVVGVDIVDRPNYPHKFIKADALEILGDLEFLSEFEAVHASPPCQAKCTLTKGTNAHLAGLYVDLYPIVMPLMYAAGKPGVIENPESRRDMVLCGEMFGLGVLRHRNIELVNWSAPKPRHIKHRGYVRGWRHGVYRDGPYIAGYGKGGGKGTVSEMQAAMGIDWTDVHEELTEAIPPAYAEYVGTELIKHLESR
ncbi:DNA methylase [Streptomyces sp. Root63]|uniref:DNA cytosine methyltransferase n=1 Tax=unclassified Streptomyces TaxID=2593676 RepID=UPI0006FD9C31|nr:MULTISPECIES: DNA cytosine methyltransferase [unclassified Streptomyces]KQX43515.1 DNA methylase [Streptomyces sp. Root1295]KRA34078.1 DNA methylase [Streptomyces sp. Root63]